MIETEHDPHYWLKLFKQYNVCNFTTDATRIEGDYIFGRQLAQLNTKCWTMRQENVSRLPQTLETLYHKLQFHLKINNFFNYSFQSSKEALN